LRCICILYLLLKQTPQTGYTNFLLFAAATVGFGAVDDATMIGSSFLLFFLLFLFANLPVSF
jgi:hypothetical protein